MRSNKGGKHRRTKKRRAPSNGPVSYLIVSISIYHEDSDLIDELVEHLQAAGHAKANRSSLIRFAIKHLGEAVNIDELPLETFRGA